MGRRVCALYGPELPFLVLVLVAAGAIGSVVLPHAALDVPTTTDPRNSTNTYCVACQSAVRAMGADGCKLVCGMMPPGSVEELICGWIVGYSQLCQNIEGWLKQGLSPENICTHMGFCGSDCQCGVCTVATSGSDGRCLGIPNSCGHNQSKSSSMHHVARGRRVENASHSDVCWDGQCGDQGSTGCCLTCF
jgi:hypothetical protein